MSDPFQSARRFFQELKRRNVYRVAGTYAVVAFVGFQAVTPPAAEASRGTAEDTLRVLVWNVHAGTDAGGEDNLDRVAALIRKTGADLALLQEMDRGTERSGGVDQPDRLARATGLGAAFGKTLDYQGGEYGIALLSRWPVEADTLVHLPVEPAQERAGGSREPRGVLTVQVAAPGGALHVLNTHLAAGAVPEVRLQEVETVLRVASGRRESEGPVLLGGDLNARPGSEVVARVREAGWTDAWASCAPSESEEPAAGGGPAEGARAGTGEDAGPDPGATYPAADPVRRIDYLFHGAGFRCVEARVLASQASDHRPLYVELVRAGPAR